MEQPVGTILAFAGENLNGEEERMWMICNGNEVGRNRFPTLFRAIGTKWGIGDGRATFNLPDLRGYFLRGRDMGMGRDPDIAGRTGFNGGSSGDAVGSYQNDAFQRHRHGNGDHTHGYNDRTEGGQQFADGGADFQAMRTPFDRGRGTGGINSNGGSLMITEPTESPGTSLHTSTESRPKNAYVHYIIKVKSEVELAEEEAQLIKEATEGKRSKRSKTNG
ncbi:MAG TPA: phage tail protein [Pyrinomonadaceae bacterium]|nr:phage tail protein [Pyrinomonadaceae bacterium]